MSKKTRTKTVLMTLATREDAELCMEEYTRSANQKAILISQRDKHILDVTERYAAHLAELDQSLEETKLSLLAWAQANPQEFAKDRKSLKLVFGTLGFRTGTPKLALLSRAWTWDKALEKLKYLKGWVACIRKKEEIDKDAILGNYSQAEDQAGYADTLRDCGLKIVQDETFFLDPDLTMFTR